MRTPDALDRCPFPKHLWEPWEDVVRYDRAYVLWLVGGEGPDLHPDLEERLVDLLEETPEEEW